MFQTIEQFSFTVLFMISQFLGVSPLPEEPSPDWEIVQNWTELPDKTYELILKSETIPQYCKEHPNHYIVFPQVQIGQHEVWQGGKVVVTNSLDKRWHIKYFFSREVVKCELLVLPREIIYRVRSLVKYYSVISSYPRIELQYPKDSIFYGPLFLIAAGICFSFALIGGLIIAILNSEVSIFNFLITQLLFGLLMFCYYPGLISSLDARLTSVVILIGLWGGLFSFIKWYFSYNSIKLFPFLFFHFLLAVFAERSGANTVQFLIILPIIPAISYFSIVLLFRALKPKKTWRDFIDIALLLFIIFSGVHDAYVVFFGPGKFLTLPLTIITLSWFAFTKLLELINAKEMEIEVFKNRFLNEEKYVKKLELLYQDQRQIIHDIKSPITSLQFALNKSEFRGNTFFQKINQRILSLINNIEKDALASSPDWYSFHILSNILKEVAEEKKYAFGDKINFNSCLYLTNDKNNSQGEVFISLIDVRNIFSELIDNSIKASLESVFISISFENFNNTNKISILYEDDGPGLENVDLAQNKGYSKGGSGYGLHGIKGKVEKMLGSFIINRTSKGFSCSIQIKRK